jgi:Alkaline phosphatase
MKPFSNRRRPLVVGSLLVTPLTVAGGAAVAGGDGSVPGGASRLDGDQSSAVREAIDGSHARNVILLIGDGMGDSEITRRRALPVRRGRTVPRHRRPPAHRPVHDLRADQGREARLRHRLGGVRQRLGHRHEDLQRSDLGRHPRRGAAHLLELAKRKGLRTGDVTTSEIQDATPAAQVSHVTERGCYGAGPRRERLRADRRDRRPRRRGQGDHDAADRGRRADDHLLRHRTRRGVAGAHRHPGPDRRLRPARRERGGLADQTDLFSTSADALRLR